MHSVTWKTCLLASLLAGGILGCAVCFLSYWHPVELPPSYVRSGLALRNGIFTLDPPLDFWLEPLPGFNFDQTLPDTIPDIGLGKPGPILGKYYDRVFRIELAGFVIGLKKMSRDLTVLRRIELRIPLAPPTLGAWLLGLILWLRWRVVPALRLRRGQCVFCAYDLRGATSPICSECGRINSHLSMKEPRDPASSKPGKISVSPSGVNSVSTNP